MNKRHYEHTLPNIRGSLSNTYFLVNSQIFSMIKISVENRLKKRNVHRFTITVRRMYILCKPCPAACMTLSFRCGSGRRLTELARIVQRPAHIIRDVPVRHHPVGQPVHILEYHSTGVEDEQ